jgi:Flp pilus assembly protein TadG
MKNNSILNKKGTIDQIMLWMVLFTIFVSFLFFVIDYSSAIRVKDNCDSVADYGARMVALGKEDAVISDGINELKLDMFPTVSSGQITCTQDVSVENYQVIFNVYATFESNFLPTSNIHSKRVVFNEVNQFQVTCNLTLN